MEDILEQLWQIYNKHENWHDFRLYEKDFKEVKKYLFNKGLLDIKLIKDTVVGYCEAWKINYEQWGKLSCGLILYTHDENIIDGNIAYIANMWIHQDYRNTFVVDSIMKDFIDHYKDCEYVVFRRKHGLPYRVYPMKYSKHFNKTGA